MKKIGKGYNKEFYGNKEVREFVKKEMKDKGLCKRIEKECSRCHPLQVYYCVEKLKENGVEFLKKDEKEKQAEQKEQQEQKIQEQKTESESEDKKKIETMKEIQIQQQTKQQTEQAQQTQQEEVFPPIWMRIIKKK